MTDHRIDTRLGQLHVRTEGAGPALVFWNSLLMSGTVWAAQVAHFSGRYRVVLIDPPGHGRSEALGRGFSFEECAGCVVQVLDTLGIGRAHVVGSSWGGMVGGTFAALHPERAGALVLMNATASPASVQQRLEYAVLVGLLGLFTRMPAPLKAVAIRAFVGPTTERSRPQVLQQLRSALGEVDTRSARWAVRSVVPQRPDQHALFAGIRSPALVIAGTEDRTFQTSDVRAMAASIQGAVYQELDSAAHLVALECPDRGECADRRLADTAPDIGGGRMSTSASTSTSRPSARWGQAVATTDKAWPCQPLICLAGRG